MGPALGYPKNIEQVATYHHSLDSAPTKQCLGRKDQEVDVDMSPSFDPDNPEANVEMMGIGIVSMCWSNVGATNGTHTTLNDKWISKLW